METVSLTVTIHKLPITKDEGVTIGPNRGKYYSEKLIT